MKRKSRVRVLGQYFKIEYCDLTADDLDGDCDPNKRIIRIEQTLEPDHMKRIIDHEVMHARLFVSGLYEGFTGRQQEALAVLAESKN